jgi:hypothetical protein
VVQYLARLLYFDKDNSTQPDPVDPKRLSRFSMIFDPPACQQRKRTKNQAARVSSAARIAFQSSLELSSTSLILGMCEFIFYGSAHHRMSASEYDLSDFEVLVIDQLSTLSFSMKTFHYRRPNKHSSICVRFPPSKKELAYPRKVPSARIFRGPTVQPLDGCRGSFRLKSFLLETRLEWPLETERSFTASVTRSW